MLGESHWNHILFALIWLFSGGFALMNGMNDISGLIGTLCSSRALTIFRAQWLAITGIWLGALLGPDAVAKTVANGIVSLSSYPERIELSIWLSAVAGALGWSYIARRLSIPSSATHSFIGAMCGATLLGTMSLQDINWGVDDLVQRHQAAGVMKVFLGLIASPLLGGTLGFGVFRFLAFALRRTSARIYTRIRDSEVAAVLIQSVTYGMNDAHSVMGLLMGACLAARVLELPAGAPFVVTLPVKVTVGMCLSIGTILGSIGIMRMVARGLYIVRPPEALAAQTAAAIAVLLAAQVGAPVSSSQVTSSALVGVGGAWRPRHVRWRKVSQIAMTWVVTFPCALGFGALVCATILLVGRVLG